MRQGTDRPAEEAGARRSKEFNVRVRRRESRIRRPRRVVREHGSEPLGPSIVGWSGSAPRRNPAPPFPGQSPRSAARRSVPVTLVKDELQKPCHVDIGELLPPAAVSAALQGPGNLIRAESCNAVAIDAEPLWPFVFKCPLRSRTDTAWRSPWEAPRTSHSASARSSSYTVILSTIVRSTSNRAGDGCHSILGSPLVVRVDCSLSSPSFGDDR